MKKFLILISSLLKLWYFILMGMIGVFLIIVALAMLGLVCAAMFK